MHAHEVEVEGVTPEQVLRAYPDDANARSIVRCFTTRIPPMIQRCPPGHYVHIPAGSGGIEANAHGWAFRRGRFFRDIVSDGFGTNRRQQARDGAWAHYNEIFAAASHALAEARMTLEGRAKRGE